jgi:xanthine dehydrogenase small subunit
MAQLISWGIVQPWMQDMQKQLAALASQAEAAAQSTPAGDPVFVAGGTDAFVQRPEALRQIPVQFLSRRPELSFIKEQGGEILIGGGTTTETLRRSDILARVLPDNKRTMTLISSTIMRNRATLAGNLVNASPIADLAIMFLALEASLELEAAGGARRTVALADFYKGYKKLDLVPGELVHTLRFAKPDKAARFSFEKVAQREFLDIASVNTALLISVDTKTITRAVLSAGGVAPIPCLLTKTAAALIGKPLTPVTVQAAAKIMEGEIAPIDDVRGSAAYKRVLLRQLLYAHFIKLFPKEFSLEALV